MPRVTILKTAYAKVETKAQKWDATLRQKLLQIRKSTAPGGDTVLWDPPKEVCEAMLTDLRREMTFVRKPEARSAVEMRDAIEKLEQLVL